MVTHGEKGVPSPVDGSTGESGDGARGGKGTVSPGPGLTPGRIRDLLEQARPGAEELGRRLRRIFTLPDPWERR